LLLPTLWVLIFAQYEYSPGDFAIPGPGGPPLVEFNPEVNVENVETPPPFCTDCSCDPSLCAPICTDCSCDPSLCVRDTCPGCDATLARIEGRIAALEQEVTQLKDALSKCVTFANEQEDIKIKGNLIFENTITQQQWIVGPRDSDHFAINKNNEGGLLIESSSNPKASTSQASPEVDTPLEVEISEEFLVEVELVV
jgi:hypothetical protein